LFDAVFNEVVSGYSTGEKARGRDIIAALRTLNEIEGREPTETERAILRRFPGFGCVALSIFPDPKTGQFREGWEQTGRELQELLTEDEYASARRTTFNAFYTSPLVMRAAFAGLERLGLPAGALVLEPGCGAGGFMGAAPSGMRFVGVEMDSVSGRIARALYPHDDIRIENFRDSRLPAVDAVIGNVPFADIRYEHGGQRFSLHDFFFAKSVDALAPGGVLALVTSRFTLDKLDGSAREYLAAQADFLGAIRLPDEAFKDQGTTVVADIVFLAKRHPGAAKNHAGDWLTLATLPLDGEMQVNAWFAERPDMVMGEFAIGRGRYGRNTLKVNAPPDYEDRLFRALRKLPEGVFSAAVVASQAACRPVPAPAGLGEGSFLIEDGAILQIECGRILPVMHGQTAVRAGEGRMGSRLAALIGLRDHAREVLKSQNEGRPEIERQDARRRLNRAYDAFVPLYGPINRTSFSVNAQGNEVRRMPNLVRFREDPDAFLVMSLEEYDEATGKAAKSRILLEDVVGPASPVTSVATAEEGLLVSLNERGRVDLDTIAALYGRDGDTVLAELGELVFLDPETGAYETRDAYLSGNVRKKLAAAREAGIEPNIKALEAIQPEDILPGDIDANLGAPWIPVDVIRAFAAGLFDVGQHAIQVDRLPKDALWSVAGDRDAEGSVANTQEFGTRRITGLALLEQALNFRTPKIYDEIRDAHGNTKRVVNQEQTVAALEKQGRIKQRFSGWIFSDPDRAERLVRIYNDTFNNLVVRTFDGSHQTFPGMNRTVALRPHQTAAIWRVVSSGNTLLAHAVGAGKTYEMAASAMKLKQTGLVRKSLIAVPNHMLEQFGREFLHLYPNARLLIAGKEDLARDRRKLLTAKIATGNWDAIVVTHSSFERIGMSSGFQEEFLKGEIAEYRALLIEAKAGNAGEDRGRNIIKTLEKRLASFEDRLKELTAGDKKDDGLVFDELGVDQVFVDEAHYFKNLATPTKMDRVAGIQTEGSERAFDLLMKARYLDRRTPGRGLVFATGTPISNTMVEMYTLKRYLAPALLEERGIGHFDAWAASFGEVAHAMEISPDGSSLRSNARFSKFVNLPELQQMFRSFADVQTADMLKLPVPVLKGGKAVVISSPMSDEQREIQAGLIARYERIGRGGVSPRDDNALAITTDGRKLALDVRLISPDAAGSQDSKLTAMFNKAAGIWRGTVDVRATQMIFCDIGVNPTGWGFSVYDEIKRGLMDRGVPGHEIADIGDADTDAKKAALFERMRAGLGQVHAWIDGENGNRDERPDPALRDASCRRAVEAGGDRAARRPDPASGQPEQRG
jgi:N12 class adenine-specific DNA methylase